MKTCAKCSVEKPYTCFHKNKAQADGYNGYCKDCRKVYDADWCLKNRSKVLEWKKQANANMTDATRHNKNTLNKLRNKRVKTATPPWADIEEMKQIYKLASNKNLVVDHIVPLKHPLVCGLNVQDNLRCIPRELNAWKANKFNQEFQSSFGIRGVDKLMELRK